MPAQHLLLSAPARGLLSDLLTGRGTAAIQAIDELTQGGWLSSGALRADAAALLGCDVGGTKVHSVLSDLSGCILAELHEPTDPAGNEALVAQITRHRDQLVAMAGGIQVMAAGIGIPGAVHPQTGHVSQMPNIAGLRDTNLAAHLSSALALPVAVENDVNLAVLGEHWRGHSADSMAFLALGTGIGLGQLVNGKLLRGASGSAGEVAMLPIGASPFAPETFQTGALESKVGAAQLIAAFQTLGGEAGHDLKSLFDLKDGRFDQVLDSLADNLARTVLSISAITDPALVVFGGSVGQRPEVVDRVVDRLQELPFRVPLCRITLLENKAGVYGALWLALATFAALVGSP